jgi:hypothetical protein
LTPSGGSSPVKRWTSHPNGIYQPPDPGALNVEFDMLIYPEATPMGASSLTVEGIRLQDLMAATDFAGMQLTMRGGMGVGLPLANPKQAGLLLSGEVFQSFGNWIGTEMNISFFPMADIHSNDNPANINFVWTASSSFASAITVALAAAYPGVPVTVNVSPSLTINHDEAHSAQDIGQLARYLLSLTQGLVDSTYPGVSIVYHGGAIFVYDGTQTSVPITVQFNDLVGQPTWISPNQIQIRTVLRSDIAVGALISLPLGSPSLPGFVQTTFPSYPSSIKYSTAFSGKFIVQAVRHVGNYRMPDGNAWVSIFNAVPKMNTGS